MPPNFLTWFLQNSLLVSRQATAPSDGAILAQDTFGMFLGNCLPSQLKTQVRKLVFGPPRILFWKKKKVPLSLLAYLIHKKSFRINYAYFFLKKKNQIHPQRGDGLHHDDYRRSLMWETESNIIMTQSQLMYIHPQQRLGTTELTRLLGLAAISGNLSLQSSLT